MSKINLLDTNALKKHSKKLSFLYPIAIVGILFFIFLHNIISADEGIFQYVVRSFSGFTAPANELTQPHEQQDRLNILLLGHGGWGHDGPNLTDSIHVVSINQDDNTAAMISVPRDLLVGIPDYGKRKINHAYALPEQDMPGSGGLVASSVVEAALGIEIDHYVTINFNGFTQLIDDLGGVDVNVPHGFVDNQYPTDDYKYQTITFEKGWHTMNGDTALKFARSRHGICTTACPSGEGSDFARAKRQQIILKAVKDKVLSSKTWRNPKKLYALLNAYQDNISTNIPLWDIATFYDIAKETDTSNIEQLVIDDSPHGLLEARNFNGAYVLVPKIGISNFDQIHVAINHFLYPTVLKPLDQQQNILVELQNGTLIGGFASKVANRLEKNGVKITKIGNAETQNIKQTLIYDLSQGARPEIIQAIQEQLPGAKISIEIPEKVLEEHNKEQIIKIHNTPIPTTERTTDFLVILGSDMYSTLGIN